MSLREASPLDMWLETVVRHFRNGFRPKEIESPFGTHGCMYHADENGDQYVTIGFNFPAETYAEIEDSTYGTLQGIRIYLYAPHSSHNWPLTTTFEQFLVWTQLDREDVAVDAAYQAFKLSGEPLAEWWGRHQGEFA